MKIRRTLHCLRKHITGANKHPHASAYSRLLDHSGRLLTSHSLIFALNLAEKAVHFITDTGSEEEFIGFARGETIAELQGPQVIDLNCNTPAIFERTEGLARIRIKGIDKAIAEIADQQCIANHAKAGRSYTHAPRAA